VSIWQSFKQEDDCLVHFVRLATTLLKDQESDNHHVLVRNSAKYSPILFFSLTDSSIYLSFLFAGTNVSQGSRGNNTYKVWWDF